MSKTTPEKVKTLEQTFNRVMNGAISMGWISDAEVQQLRTTLIDEARGVDAEPVAIYRGTIDCGEHGAFDLEILKMIPRNANLYTRPAPSQPAAPVELPKTVRLGDAPETLNINDKAFWVIGYNKAIEDAQAAIAAGRKVS